jgi:nucleoside-diphosphate-sugar epimerase
VRHLCRIGAELVVGDVTEPECLPTALEGMDTVFHAAGILSAVRAAQLTRVNADGTWNIAQACAQRESSPVLVLVSSLAAAGPAAPGTIRDESLPPAPISTYGRSKRAAEQAAEAWADRVPTTIVRPGVVFGRWDRHMLPVFRLIANAGIHFIPTFAPPPLSVIDVDDLAQHLILAAEKGTRVGGRAGNGHSRPAGYYFACADEYPTYTDLGRMVGRAAGRRHVLLWHLAEPLPWLVGGIGQLSSFWTRRPSLVNLDKMTEAIVPSWASSPQASREDLGFTPKAPVEQQLRQTVAWYRKRRWL